MATFLRYWLILILSLVSTTICHTIGILDFVWQNDTSFISAIIFVIFWVLMALCGFHTYYFCRDNESLDRTNNRIEMGMFFSDMLFQLGLLGTALGLMFMVGQFKNIDATDTNSIKNLIGQLGSGLSVALLTTITGLICGCILKITYFNLGYYCNEIESRVLDQLVSEMEDDDED